MKKLSKEVGRYARQLRRARKLRLEIQIVNCKIAYSSTRNKYTAEIRRAKAASWRNFIMTIGFLRDHNGIMTNTWSELILLLCRKFFPRDERQDENEKQKETRQRNSRYRNQNLEPDITDDELRKALK